MDINTFLKFLAVMILGSLAFMCGRNSTAAWGYIGGYVCLGCIVLGILMIFGIVH